MAISISYANMDMVENLAINVKQGVPPEILAIAIGQADRYVSAKMIATFNDWAKLALAPELVPDQVVVASSLIAAGKVECMMFAVNTAGGKSNQYGMDLEQEGLMIIDDLVNARIVCLGFTRQDPTSVDSPEHTMHWVGGLLSQGWIPLEFSNMTAVAPITIGPLIIDGLTDYGYISTQVEPIQNWFSTLGFKLAYDYIDNNTDWLNYISTIQSDLARMGVSKVLCPLPNQTNTSLGTLIQTLNSSGITVSVQTSPSTPLSILASFNALGIEFDVVEGPALVTIGDDTTELPVDMCTAIHFTYKNVVGSPQFVGTSPNFFNYQGVIDYVDYASAGNELTPESSQPQLLFYAGRVNPSGGLHKPIKADLAVSGEDKVQAAYQLWAVMKVYYDMQKLSMSPPGPIHLVEHVDQNGHQWGLRTFSGGIWTDKPSMSMWANMYAILGNSTTKSELRFPISISNLPNMVILSWVLANGSIAVMISTGLTSTQTALVNLLFSKTYRVNLYVPTDSSDVASSSLAKSMSLTLDYRPIILVLSQGTVT